MSYEFQSSYAVGSAQAEDRALFIRRVYMHLAGALVAFAGLEYLLFNSELGKDFARFVFSNGGGTWLLVLGGFAIVTWLARGMATGGSLAMQYVGMGIYIFAEALIFVPLIYLALAISGDKILLTNAVILTAILFLGLTTVGLTQRRDFSFLGAFISVGGLVALGLIVCGAMFGWNLGLAFSGGMIVLASASILFDTSNVMHRYPADQYVGASLELFASVILLLWYVIRILMSLSRR